MSELHSKNRNDNGQRLSMSQEHSCGHSDGICSECHNTLFHFGEKSNKNEIGIQVTKLTLQSLINTLEARGADSVSKSELKQLIDSL